MSEDRIVHGPDPAEEGTTTDEEQDSNRCSQISALCCCIPRRRTSLPGKRPMERKKKKNAGGISFSDIMLEEEMDRACWNISVGDQDTVQHEAIQPTQPLCPQAYGTKDHSILLPMGAFYLEGKQKDYDEKPVVQSFDKKGKATSPSKEEADDWSILSSETENKSPVAAVSEGLPVGKDISSQVIPDKGDSQVGRPESVAPSLMEGAHKKEQQGGGNPASIISEGVPCKMVWEKQEQQAAPFQELRPSGRLEDLKCPLPETEIKMQEQNDTSTDYEGAVSLTELLTQPQIPQSEEEQLLGQQQLTKDVTHKVEEQVACDRINAVPKEDIHKKVQVAPDTFYQEVWQPVELKYPESLPIRDKNYEQEQSVVLRHVDPVPEASHSEREHSYRKIVGKEVQRPIIRKATSYSFQDTTYKKEQGEGSPNSTSDSPLNKAGESQWIPHQAVVQEWIPPHWIPPNHNVVQENKTTVPLVVTCATEQQKLAHTNNTLDDPLVYTASQKKEGMDHLYSGSQGIALTEEKENPGLLLSENAGTLPDNISSEKEQQRKLECGDSGSESLYDKEEQDCLAYLEGQPPLVLEQLGSGPLSGTSEAELCSRKSGTLEMNPLEEQPVKYGDQSQKLLSDQEEQEITMFPTPRWKAQGEQMEARHTLKDTFIPHKEQLQRELFDLGMTCEEHQGKGKQDLPETRSSCSTRKDENM